MMNSRTPEEQAEFEARTRPMLDRLAAVLNELDSLGGQQVVTENGVILTAAGAVVYRHYGNPHWIVEVQS